MMELSDNVQQQLYQLTAHDATERQDDKSPNDTQSQTIVYGKEGPEAQE